MIATLAHFLRDESGAATVDSIVVLGGSMWMSVALAADVGAATIDVTDKINERLEYSSVVAEILGEYGPGSDGAGGTEGGAQTNSSSNSVETAGCDSGGNAGSSNSGWGGWNLWDFVNSLFS